MVSADTTSCTLLQPPKFQQLLVAEHPSSICFSHCASQSQMPHSHLPAIGYILQVALPQCELASHHLLPFLCLLLMPRSPYLLITDSPCVYSQGVLCASSAPWHLFIPAQASCYCCSPCVSTAHALNPQLHLSSHSYPQPGPGRTVSTCHTALAQLPGNHPTSPSTAEQHHCIWPHLHSSVLSFITAVDKLRNQQIWWNIWEFFFFFWILKEWISFDLKKTSSIKFGDYYYTTRR